MQSEEKESKSLSDYNVTYLIKRFFQDYLKPNFKAYLPVQVGHILSALIGLIPPMLLRRLIDEAIPSKDLKAIIIISLWALGTFLARSLIRMAKQYWGHKIAQKVVYDMRNDLYAHFQDLPMKFHDNKKTGELMSRVIDDLNRIQEFAHHGPEGVVFATTKIVGVLIMLFVLNIPLTLIALAFTPFLIGYSYFLTRKMHKAFRENRVAKANLNDKLEDNLAGVKVVKAFANEAYEMERFSQKNREHYNARLKAIKYISLLGPGAFLLNSVGLVVTLGFGGYLVTQGTLTAGTVVAFYTYLLGFRGPILRLVRINQGLSRFLASVERFFSYIDIEPDIDSKSEAVTKEKGKIKGKVKFKNVYFSYNGEDRVLKNINIDVQPKKTVALVGPSGSGKTTFVRLISRLYEVDGGAVEVDGIDVKDWDLEELRDSIAVVMQDDYLFSGTIKENIAYGKPDATEEEIIKMAKEANAHQFVTKMPNGYETKIGQRGVKLSGGQRQRVSIARALLKNPEILILDEATSSVDSYTEKLIQEAIEKVSEGRTTFTIAHRLSTIVNADEIIFIEDGEIEERGSYKELMEKDGKFKKFYNMQFDMNVDEI